MSNVIVKEGRSPLYEKNRKGEDVIVGSMTYKEYADGSIKVGCNNDKNFTDEALAKYRHAIEHEQPIRL